MDSVLLDDGFQLLINKEIGLQIPETVIFENGKPIHWYSSESGQIRERDFPNYREKGKALVGCFKTKHCAITHNNRVKMLSSTQLENLLADRTSSINAFMQDVGHETPIQRILIKWHGEVKSLTCLKSRTFEEVPNESRLNSNSRLGRELSEICNVLVELMGGNASNRSKKRRKKSSELKDTIRLDDNDAMNLLKQKKSDDGCLVRAEFMFRFHDDASIYLLNVSEVELLVNKEPTPLPTPSLVATPHSTAINTKTKNKHRRGSRRGSNATVTVDSLPSVNLTSYLLEEELMVQPSLIMRHRLDGTQSSAAHHQPPNPFSSQFKKDMIGMTNRRQSLPDRRIPRHPPAPRPKYDVKRPKGNTKSLRHRPGDKIGDKKPNDAQVNNSTKRVKHRHSTLSPHHTNAFTDSSRNAPIRYLRPPTAPPLFKVPLNEYNQNLVDNYSPPPMSGRHSSLGHSRQQPHSAMAKMITVLSMADNENENDRDRDDQGDAFSDDDDVDQLFDDSNENYDDGVSREASYIYHSSTVTPDSAYNALHVDTSPPLPSEGYQRKHIDHYNHTFKHNKPNRVDHIKKNKKAIAKYRRKHELKEDSQQVNDSQVPKLSKSKYNVNYRGTTIYERHKMKMNVEEKEKQMSKTSPSKHQKHKSRISHQPSGLVSRTQQHQSQQQVSISESDEGQITNVPPLKIPQKPALDNYSSIHKSPVKLRTRRVLSARNDRDSHEIKTRTNYHPTRPSYPQSARGSTQPSIESIYSASVISDHNSNNRFKPYHRRNHSQHPQHSQHSPHPKPPRPHHTHRLFLATPDPPIEQQSQKNDNTANEIIENEKQIIEERDVMMNSEMEADSKTLLNNLSEISDLAENSSFMMFTPSPPYERTKSPINQTIAEFYSCQKEMTNETKKALLKAPYREYSTGCTELKQAFDLPPTTLYDFENNSPYIQEQNPRKSPISSRAGSPIRGRIYPDLHRSANCAYSPSFPSSRNASPRPMTRNEILNTPYGITQNGSISPRISSRSPRLSFKLNPNVISSSPRRNPIPASFMKEVHQSLANAEKLIKKKCQLQPADVLLSPRNNDIIKSIINDVMPNNNKSVFDFEDDESLDMNENKDMVSMEYSDEYDNNMRNPSSEVPNKESNDGPKNNNSIDINSNSINSITTNNSNTTNSISTTNNNNNTISPTSTTNINSTSINSNSNTTNNNNHTNSTSVNSNINNTANENNNRTSTTDNNKAQDNNVTAKNNNNTIITSDTNTVLSTPETKGQLVQSSNQKNENNQAELNSKGDHQKNVDDNGDEANNEKHNSMNHNHVNEEAISEDNSSVMLETDDFETVNEESIRGNGIEEKNEDTNNTNNNTDDYETQQQHDTDNFPSFVFPATLNNGSQTNSISKLKQVFVMPSVVAAPGNIYGGMVMSSVTGCSVIENEGVDIASSLIE